MMINKQKANKKYYVGIRAYKNVGGKKYSAWSGKKIVTAKKSLKAAIFAPQLKKNMSYGAKMA